VPRHISFDAVRPGTVFADRYFVVRPIKSGGMGAVYEVQHVRTHKPHALKIMHPDVVAKKGAREKFEQEAYVGARIQSRHVVDVTDAGVDEATGLPYLVMELLVGSELGTLVEREGKVDPTRLIRWFEQLARALDKAHARGIIHRDLKPENIFITKTEEGLPDVKVLDFGIAKIVEGATKEGTDETGTPLYMAPEQTARGQVIGPGTDVWALAIVIYECLVGQTYWRAKSVAEFYRELLFDELPLPTARAAEDGVNLPQGFDQWFFGCVNRDPNLRFKTASEAMKVLAAVYGLEPSASRSGSHPGVETIATAKTERPPASVHEDAVSARTVASELDDDELPQFSNRRRTMGVVVAVVVLGGIGAAVFAARSMATTSVPPTTSIPTATAIPTSAAPVPTGPPATVEEAKRLAEPRRNACISAAQKKNPTVRGKLVVEFQIDDEGSAAKEKIVESTFGDPELEVCLLGVIRSLRITPAEQKDPKKKPPKAIYTYSVEQT
jgi:serine/threonine protein kinase